MLVILIFNLKSLFVSTAGLVKTDGDILIGGLFPIHNMGADESICGSFNSNPGYQYMEAMLYALDTINADPNILPGVKLGSVIADTCSSKLISSRKTRKFIHILLETESSNSSQLVSVVGPMTGSNAKAVANILQVFHVPQISYGAMSAHLSKKEGYGYFFRTVASNQFFNSALAAFLGRMGWRYIGLVYSDSIWSRFNADRFTDKMKQKHICVGPRLDIHRYTKEKDFDKYIEKLVSGDSEPNIVIIMTSTQDSRAMLAAKKRNPRGNKLTFVSGVRWGNRKSITQGFYKLTI
jgi:ABC-type branched-subunit amino acid transport system substrate-binding protein